MESYQQFEAAVLEVFEQQPDYSTVICSSVISAVHGEYGNYHLTKRTDGSILRISPLMPFYWFFDLPAVARWNVILPALRLTYDVDEAYKSLQEARKAFKHRPAPERPLA